MRALAAGSRVEQCRDCTLRERAREGHQQKRSVTKPFRLRRAGRPVGVEGERQVATLTGQDDYLSRKPFRVETRACG
jgi:hypothetical protein